MNKRGNKKTNVATARSLLSAVYVILKENRAYEEPDPKQMRETEKAKLVRHHSKRLRQLGADEVLSDQMVGKLNAKQTEPVLQPSPPRILKTLPAKVCRAAPWDSGLVKLGNKNIRLSKNERPPLLRRRGLNLNGPNQRNPNPK